MTPTPPATPADAPVTTEGVFICSEGHPHGKNSTCYTTHRCRCGDCREGRARYERERSRQRAYAQYQDIPPTRVPVENVRDHIAYLQSHGHTHSWIAARANVNERTVWKYANRWHKNVGVDIEARILKIRPDFDSLSPGHVIPVRGTLRRIQALAVQGWSQSELARHLGMDSKSLGSYFKSPGVYVRTHKRIAALYDELWDQTPPADTRFQRGAATLTKKIAAKAGWVGPLGWDDIDNDPEPAPPIRRCRVGHLITDANARPTRSGHACVACFDAAERFRGHTFDPEWRDNRYRELVPDDDPDITDVDDETVHRALRGEPVTLTYRERRAAIRIAHTWRWADALTGERIHLDIRDVERIRTSLGLKAWPLSDLVTRTKHEKAA